MDQVAIQIPTTKTKCATAAKPFIVDLHGKWAGNFDFSIKYYQ